MAKLMVWIDQDLCTGDGICEEITPDVFHARDDGLWVVKEESSHFGQTVIFDGEEGDGHGPDGARGLARGKKRRRPTIRGCRVCGQHGDRAKRIVRGRLLCGIDDMAVDA